MTTATTPLRLRAWPIALGLTGFAAGFVGPILVNPDANQGPLVGLFITGPGGAIGGLMVGLVARFLPYALQRKVLSILCAALAIATLFYCLPETKTLGYIIDAEVTECMAPKDVAQDALTTWQQAVARTTWYTPPADWKQTAMRNVNSAEGAVLTLNIARRASVLEHHKPWNSGKTTITAWQSTPSNEHYYASDAGDDCSTYLARTRQLYMPFTRAANPNTPDKTWPPTDVPSFLHLMELGPVPGRYLATLNSNK
jgi:hypothetical protein